MAGNPEGNPDCVLHEQRLSSLEDSLEHIRTSLHKLVGRPNDIIIKVINGKTEERLASELIGEMYVAIKQLKEQSPKSIWDNFGKNITPLLNLLTIIGLIITMITVFHK